MKNLEVLVQTSKTRIRKMPYNKSYLYTTEFWFNEKWIDTGHSRTLKEAKIICDDYENKN